MLVLAFKYRHVISSAPWHVIAREQGYLSHFHIGAKFLGPNSHVGMRRPRALKLTVPAAQKIKQLCVDKSDVK